MKPASDRVSPLSKLPLGNALVRKLFYSGYLVAFSRFGWRGVNGFKPAGDDSGI